MASEASLQLIACANRSSSHAGLESSPDCFQYYSGSRVSWYSAHAICYSQGLTLAAIDAQLDAQIYWPQWIAENRVWERPTALNGQFLERLRTMRQNKSLVWFVNAHRHWYAIDGPALANGTRLEALRAPRGTRYTTDQRHGDEYACVVYKTFARRFHFNICSNYLEGEALFVCSTPSESISKPAVASNALCPQSYTRATFNGIPIGKCYKYIQGDSNIITWDKARGTCSAHGGDLVSLTNDVERVWFENLIRSIKQNQTDASREILIYVNLHEFLYCISPTEWCWSNRVRQQDTNSPKPKLLLNSNEPSDGVRATNCGVVKIGAGTQFNYSLSKVVCNTQSDISILIICETNHIRRFLKQFRGGKMSNGLLSINASTQHCLDSQHRKSNPLLVPLAISVAVAVALMFLLTSIFTCPRVCTRAPHNSNSIAAPNGALRSASTPTRPDASNQIPSPIATTKPLPVAISFGRESAAYSPAPNPYLETGFSAHQQEFEDIYDSGSISPTYDRVGVALGGDGTNRSSSAEVPTMMTGAPTSRPAETSTPPSQSTGRSFPPTLLQDVHALECFLLIILSA